MTRKGPMAKIRRAFADLTALYNNVPAVPCTGCGYCCVSPTMTVVEFAFLLDHIFAHLAMDEIASLLTRPMEPAAHMKGNTLCPLQKEDKHCRFYGVRCLSCRIEGIPALEGMGIREERICPHITEDQVQTEVTAESVDTWIQEVFRLSQPVHEVSVEPYFLNAVNLECWWAIALDRAITQPFFTRIREALWAEWDLAELQPHYVDHTRLALKLSLIDTFFAESEAHSPQKALKAIRRVIHEFPQTGTYYQHEGQEYFKLMKRVVQQQGK